jgi:uncharacterized protein
MVTEILLLCLVAFLAGFMDSIVGGGGLLQTPAIMTILPQYPLATLLGTTKIPSLSGTAIAAVKYSGKVKLNYRLLGYIIPAAFSGALLGACCIDLVDSARIKPVMLVILLGVLLYTFSKKSLGTEAARTVSVRKQVWSGVMFGFAIGFYDGMIGPGTGTFLILSFISFAGMDFLGSSANAKLVNAATNIAAVIYFSFTGNVLFQYAIPMAIFNMAGSFTGSQLALYRGNKFIRYFFMAVVLATMLKFAYDVVK